MQSDNPEYTESSAGEYTRSYDIENDALGHQKTGVIWSGAQAAGRSVKDFGEFQSYESKPAAANWQNLYCDSKNMAATGAGTAYPIKTGSAIPSLNDVAVQGFPPFDLDVPDIYREQIWKQDFEKNGPANLNMFWFSNDHTGGPANAAAEVADNDLAVGRMVDEITHSTYWKDSAIFVVEDDSQVGLDHVDGHRAPVQVISPYAQHGKVDHHYYSQITMVRTVEQILGIHPMNQLDSAATPMYGAFTGKADTTPFTTVPNRTSLTLGVNPQPACGSDTPALQDRKAAAAPTSVSVPVAEKSVAAHWRTWASRQRLTGQNAVPACPSRRHDHHLGRKRRTQARGAGQPPSAEAVHDSGGAIEVKVGWASASGSPRWPPTVVPQVSDPAGPFTWPPRDHPAAWPGVADVRTTGRAAIPP